MEPRIALKPATGPYTDPVESTESRQILTLLVHFNIILPSTRVFQENALWGFSKIIKFKVSLLYFSNFDILVRSQKEVGRFTYMLSLPPVCPFFRV